MRYPAQQKAETRDKILATAARTFRQNGAAAHGIGAVMQELGLTKGGFYRHFESKDDLFAAAVERALAGLGQRLSAVAAAAPQGRELPALIDAYLSDEHLRAPGAGCPVAALGPEFARQSPAARHRLQEALLGYCGRLLRFVPGRSLEEKRRRAFLLFSGMAGTLMTLRALPDTPERARLLESARAFYKENL